MQTEFEATFTKVDKDLIRERLKQVGAELIYPETLFKRDVFDPPIPIKGGWLRVRKEVNKTTMSLKIVGDDDKIENQKEIELEINDYDQGVKFLRLIGASHKSYQETKRELWRLDGVDVTIDTWPGLSPFVEVEGVSEQIVKDIAIKLGFDYADAVFGAVDIIYEAELGIPKEVINRIPIITFDNPPTIWTKN